MMNNRLFDREKYDIVYEYTFKEMLGIENFDTSEVISPSRFRDEKLIWGYNYDLSVILSDPLMEELWKNYLVPRFLNSIVAVSSSNIHPTTKEEYNLIYGEFWHNFESITQSTFKRYSKLLNLYKENESRLLARIQSVTTSGNRVNMTPQVAAIDPYDSKFTNESNTGEITVETDGTTIASRLSELRRMWTDLYNEWAECYLPIFSIN